MTQGIALFDQITRTKVIRPRRRSDVLTRQRLVKIFRDLLEYRLFIVSAPAGYGKTSFLVDAAHQTDLPVCWYALDALDTDPQRFFIHFIAAIAHCFPNFGLRSATVLESAALDNGDLDRLVTTIINEIYDHIQEHFIIVLDDWHLANNQQITYFINRFIQLVDENCHLIIASRTSVTLPDLALMVGRAQVSGLLSTDLAFKADEIQAFISQNFGQTLSELEAEELVKESEGWITGLLLSAQTMQPNLAERLRLARVSGVDVYDYLAQQVLEWQPPAVQDFLLRTSLLEEFNAELCWDALGPAAYPTGESWPELMDMVVKNNLFVMPVDNSQTWLRYHRLFQDFLQRRLEAEQPAEKVRVLHRLATAYDERQVWDKAYHLYQRLNDTKAAADLIERAGLPLVRRGRLTTLAQWIDALPVNLLISRSRLLSLRGIAAVMLGSPDQGLSLLNRAGEVSTAANELSELVRALVWRAVAYRFKGDYQASLADADEAINLTGQHGNLTTSRAEALRAKGMALYRLGYIAEAVNWLEQALDACNNLKDDQTAPILLFELGITYSDAGHYNQALQYCNQALDHWQQTNNITWQANLLYSQGIIYHLKGDYGQAVVTLEDALAYARQSGYARLEAATLTGIGDIYVELEALDAGSLAYAKAREIAERINDNLLLFYLNIAQAALARSQKNFPLAWSHLSSARHQAQESNSCYEQGLCLLETGRLYLAEGSASEASAGLEKAIHYINQGGQRIEEIKSHLYLAVTYECLGNEPKAIAHQSFAFNLASDLDNQHPMIVAGRDAKKFLERVKFNPMIGHQVSRLLQQIGQFEQNLPANRRRLRKLVSAIPFAMPKLIIRTLGKAQVLQNGQPITGPEWQTQKRVRELFFYLLAHPDGLTREAIGVDLWPDSSPRQLKLQFKNTVYRLRRALDKEAVLFDSREDRYFFNRRLDYEYDVEIFLKELDRAKIATSPEARIAAYRTAVNLYNGPYLLEADGTWIWPERERLSQAYLEANLALVEYFLDAGDYNTTLKYCQKALAEDPTIEEAHRQAMRVYAALGNRVAIIRQFERCRQALLEELDAPVSLETDKLYEILVR